MDTSLNYQFNHTAQMIGDVATEYREFQATLEAFKSSYARLASVWGGAASEGATAVATRIDAMGDDVATILRGYIGELDDHLADSRHTENKNIDRFS